MEVSKLMRELNNDVFKLFENDYLINLGTLEQSIMQTRWMGYPPTTLKAIAKKEQQLDIVLPQSYRDFLLVSNGFRNICPSIYNLYPIEKINWAGITEDEWWLNGIECDPKEMSDPEYLVYGKSQRPEFFRPEYFRTSLKISDWGDACCLFLNPSIKHDDEWELLFYATWFPGTERYRSFKEFLLRIHQSNQELLRAK